MKVSKTSRSPGPGARPKCKAASHQEVAFPQGAHWRDGKGNSPRATRAIAHLGPLGNVLFGRRIGAGGGVHQTYRQMVPRSLGIPRAEIRPMRRYSSSAGSRWVPGPLKTSSSHGHRPCEE